MALEFTVSVTGLAAIRKRTKDALVGIENGYAAALYQKGLQIDADSVRLTPVDTGRLRASHYVRPPRDVNNPVVEVGNGVDYAVPVHERTEIAHEVGEAKFLEKAINKHRPGFARDVAKMTASNFKRKIGLRAVRSTAPETPEG